MREFLGAMGYPDDSRSQVVMRDDQSTDPNGPMWPNGHNMMAAMSWLISEPNTVNFLHYSGHGGQVADDGDNRVSGFDDTIVPVDFESRGQVSSGILHHQLVTNLPPSSTLFIIMDCCHSGSAVELPYVYRSDEDGNVSMMDNVKMGVQLFGEASHLIQGGFTTDKVGEAKQLLAGATSFFRSLTHEQEQTDQYGLGEQDTADEYRSEGAKQVWMYSGCRDDQTSADASIAGSHVGAMRYALPPFPTITLSLSLTPPQLGLSRMHEEVYESKLHPGPAEHETDLEREVSASAAVECRLRAGSELSDSYLR